MRYLIVTVLSVWMCVVGGMAQAQVLPVCNENSGLEWTLNVEPDMKEYMLYHGPTAGVAIGGTGVSTQVIPHDPSSAVNGMVIYPLTLPEGDTYMAVTAKDQSGNETALSNEVACTVNLIPATPNIILRFNLPPQ